MGKERGRVGPRKECTRQTDERGNPSCDRHELAGPRAGIWDLMTMY